MQSCVSVCLCVRVRAGVADLWLSCTPLRLVMVSSRFCRRSRTFCTVLFLWDSGSAEVHTHKHVTSLVDDINTKHFTCKPQYIQSTQMQIENKVIIIEI